MVDLEGGGKYDAKGHLKRHGGSRAKAIVRVRNED
jgi:hypothetical protein